MRSIFHLFFLTLIACGGASNSESTNQDFAEAMEDAVSSQRNGSETSTNRVLHAHQNEQTSNSEVDDYPSANELEWGIEMKELDGEASFCKLMQLGQESQLSAHIRSGKCKDSDNSDLTLLNGQVVFPKLKKTYKMLVYLFKEDVNTKKEIPLNGDLNVLGNNFVPVEMMENDVKAFISSDMLRIYLNKKQKILISTFMEDQGVREIPADTKSEMLAIGNSLVRKLKQD